MSQRIEGGLYQLQQSAAIIVFVCVLHSKSIPKAESKLNAQGHSLSNVAVVLKENAIDILADIQTYGEDDIDEADGEATKQSKKPDKDELAAMMTNVGQLYQLWSDSILESNGHDQDGATNHNDENTGEN
jgi:hypothetical protein